MSNGSRSFDRPVSCLHRIATFADEWDLGGVYLVFLFGRLVGCLAGWLAGWWLAGWLAGWLVGWLVGGLVSRSVGWAV